MKKNNTGRIAAGILSVLILITSFPNVSAAEELPETEMIMQDAEEAEENVSDEEQDRIDEVKDSGIDEVRGNDNPGKTEVSTWTDLQEALGDVRVSEIKLSGDISADDSDECLQAAGDEQEERAVTIDLNGFELNRNLSKHKHNGHVIEVSEKAALTIKDTGTDKTGKITGGWSSEDGGGIRVENGGALTVEDAYITGNRSDGNGGGIHVENGGTLIIEGGSISNNRAGGDGGGICSYGTVNMTEGSVTGNTASSGGGGIFVGAGNDAAFRADNVLIVDNHALDENGGGIKNTGKAVLDNCDVGGNTSQGNGGGVFTDDGDLELTGCRIHDNSSKDDGGGIYNNKTLSLKGGSVYGNISHNNGGGIYVGKSSDSVGIEGDLWADDNIADSFGNDVYLNLNKTLTLTGKLTSDRKIGVDLEGGTGTITKNYRDHHPEEDPGKYFFARGFNLNLDNSREVKITSSWSDISTHIQTEETFKLDRDYTATDRDEGFKIYDGGKHVIDLNGHTLNLNRKDKNEDGHVFAVGNGSRLTIRDSSSDKSGKITGGWSDFGGGIFVERGSVLELQGGTISGNRADKYGGAVYVDGRFNMNGGAIKNNSSHDSGGGVYISGDGIMKLIKGLISGNRTDECGGGIFCFPDSELQVFGNPIVKDNHAKQKGSDIWLPKNAKIKIWDMIETGASLYVSTEEELGVFTQGYDIYNNKADPARFFSSPEGFSVCAENGEAVLVLDRFGETENEKPFIHRDDQVKTDAGLLCGNNWMSGISGERYLHEINMPGSHDSGMVKAFYCFPDHTIEDRLYRETSDKMSSFAETQKEYIDVQLEEGGRQFDIRLNDQKKKEFHTYSGTYYGWYDDGKNLWIGHGTTEYGHYPALAPDEEFLSFYEVLEWVKDFLEKHPTETVILNLRAETPVAGHGEAIAERARQILTDSALGNNPSTGDSYLYKEKGSDDYFSEYTDMPKLKDCRGKIVIMVEDSTFHERVGGFSRDDDSFPVTIVDSTPLGKDAAETVDEIKNKYAEFNPDGMKKLPSDSDKQYNELRYWELNGAAESHPRYEMKQPLDQAEYVNPRVIGDGNVFNPGLAGQYIGWVRMDGFKAEYAETIWQTNFFAELDYKTVTVRSGLDSDNYPDQKFRVLKGTKIIIPGNICKNLPKGKYFEYWKEGTDPDAEGAKWYRGDEFTVNDDVVFTAKWKTDRVVPISIVWNDGNDLDQLRGDSVEMTVIPEEGEPRTIELTPGNHWSAEADADADSDVIVPAWDKIRTDEDPNGVDREGEYRYELTHEAGSGFVFTFTHTPIGRTDIKGTVEWDDDNNANRKRPKNVTVRLFANGKSTNRSIKVTPDGEGQWIFDFGEQPLYENAKLINYSVTEDDISGYSISFHGLNITNAYKSKETVEAEGTIRWNDDGNALGKRPDNVTVILKANKGDAPEVNPFEVKADENGKWRFFFKDLPASDPSGKPGNRITYNIAVNDIPDYTVAVKNVSSDFSSEDHCGIIAFEVECTLIVAPGNKEDSKVTREPGAVTRTYNGKEQTLIKKGTCTGGTFMYAVSKQGGSVPDDKSFSEKLPVATDAGTYTVWYFVKGDVLHNDTEKKTVEECVIDKRQVTFTGISATRKYTGHLQKINEIKVDGLLSGQTHNVVYEAKGTDIGVYKGIITSEKKAVIRSGDKVVTGNYEITVKAGKLTIAKDPKLRLEVGFDTQGGKPAAIEPVDDISPGDYIQLPADPYKNNCDFDGWYTKPGGQGTKFTEDISVVKNMVLYAYFIPHGIYIKGLSESGYVYTGSEIVPSSVEVYDYKTLLNEGKDYTISYRNNKNVAEKDSENAPTVTVKGKGNYSGTVTEAFPIVAKSIEDEDVTVSEIASAAYKTKAYTPVPVITFNKKKLANKKDFEVRYYADKKCSGNTVVPMEPKKYYAKISGIGNYTGSRILDFVIASSGEVPVSELTIGKIADIQYDDGDPITPPISVKFEKTELKQGEDYDIAYNDNREIGTASVVITGKGRYAGKRTVTFSITGTSLKKVPLTGFAPSVPFTDGSPIEQAVTLQKKGDRPLRGILKAEYDEYDFNEKRAYDYTIEYADNIEIGTATLTLTGVNGYFDQVVKTFKITGTDINSAKIMGFVDSFDYDGKEHKQNIVLKDKGKDLVEDQDYTIEYLNNTDIGTATLIVTGIKKWFGSIKKTYKINPGANGMQISKAVINDFRPSLGYNGSERTQADVKLIFNGNALTKDKDYTITYEKNTNAGTATMIINGKGSCYGSVKKTFKITPYDISSDTENKISIDIAPEYYYSKSGVKPKPTVRFGDTVLTEGVDYTLGYANNTAVNEGTEKVSVIKVTGKGNFSKTDDKTTFKIKTSFMPDAGLRIVTGSVIYTAKPGNWKTTVSVVEPDGKKLTANKDYTVKFTKDKAGESEVGDKEVIPAGTFIYVHVKAKEGSDYSGKLMGSFRIYRYDIGKLTVTVDPKTYTGTEVKLEKGDITWKSGNSELDDVAFKIDESTYVNNVDKGIASVTVIGTGNCTGSKKISFAIGLKSIILWWMNLFN